MPESVRPIKVGRHALVYTVN